MESKAENVVQNIGAIAETVSIFYNSIVKQVPRDVAIILTQHFMDLTIARRTVTPAQLAQAAALAEAKRKELEKKRRQNPPETQAPEQEKTPPESDAPQGECPPEKR